MDECSNSQFEGLGSTLKRRRSQTSRRSRPETHSFPPRHDSLSLSSFLVSDDANKVSSYEVNSNTNSEGKIFSLNQCLSKGSSNLGAKSDSPYKRTKKQDGGLSMLYCNGDMGEDVNKGQDAPAKYSRTVVDIAENENRLKKVKLKVGGVTRTIRTKSGSNGASGGGSSMKSAQSSDPTKANSDQVNSSSPDKKGMLQGNSSKDFSGGGYSCGRMRPKVAVRKQGDKSGPLHKSKKVLKSRAWDVAFDDEDDEIRYLEKLESSKASGYREFEEESGSKQHSLTRFGKYEDVGRSITDGRKTRSKGAPDDGDYEEEVLSENDPEGKKNMKPKGPSDFAQEIKREMALTTRQRALLSSKDASSASGGLQIEFPNGLPSPPPRKQREKLSEVEQQLKKTEAAQRRRMQNEKAARESEAEAIRKILGQDSSRKKREEQKKKRREELAQEKAANDQMLASTTIRWVMGPAGTIVTFPQDMGLPQIFDSKPFSYPPPREKCAGPACTNVFRYRDPGSKLPLCSLQCYKAIHETMQAEIIHAATHQLQCN